MTNSKMTKEDKQLLPFLVVGLVAVISLAVFIYNTGLTESSFL